MTAAVDVAIIGAGPYGLSISAHLSARSIRHRIFGPPMQTWRAMPKGMFLKSVDFATSIYAPRPGHSLVDYCRERGISSAEPLSMELFSRYGLWAQEQLVPHLEQVEVTRLAQAGTSFEIGLANGDELTAHRVVMATGLAYFSHMPPVLRGLPEDLVTHTSQHREYESFRGKDVVVLGAGQSALEAAVMLYEAGARPQLLSRCDGASFADPPLNPRPLRHRILHPMSVLGGSRIGFFLQHVPHGFHFLPDAKRVELTRKLYGPWGAWWLAPRFRGKVPGVPNTDIVSATGRDGRLVLRLRDRRGGSERDLVIDHLVAGTGYRPDLDVIAFLDGGLRSRYPTNRGLSQAVSPLRKLRSGPLLRRCRGRIQLRSAASVRGRRSVRRADGRASARARSAADGERADVDGDFPLTTPMPSILRLASRANDAAGACALAWREGGIGGLRRLVEDAAYWRLHPRVREWRAELPRQQAIDEAFDRRFGVDTAGEVHLADVGISWLDVERGHGRYRPVWTSAFHEAMGSLAIPFDRFTFVDYGSGKGKALLLASDYPFDEIIGIEFARPLHDVATQNIRRYASPTMRCRALRSECVDALDFAPPSGPMVCFFFNPFDDATTDAVIARLVGLPRREPPREIFVVYCNMRDVKEHLGAFRRRSGLELIAQRRRFLTFRASIS